MSLRVVRATLFAGDLFVCCMGYLMALVLGIEIVRVKDFASGLVIIFAVEALVRPLIA